MTDYSKMSNFEINKAVAYHIGLRTVEMAEDGEFKPCNNPSDAWPILKEYCIDINWDGDSDSKPLRDAMIVYLMMKESENG